MSDEHDDYTLSPAQEIGLALAFSHKVTEALQRAAEAEAIVITREPTQELRDEVVRVLELETNLLPGERPRAETLIATLESVSDFLGDALGE